MQIENFLAAYPEAKENPELYVARSLMKQYHWDKSEKADRENEIILMDFIEEYNYLVDKIKNYEK